ncbi:hypothetical protein DFP93_13412 [Aneurinibacillus soli]|uniref:Uncharacterized protein n=1 Tax=Aneurinibacillus soli TaxID=1500254 RepID=A0A0U4WMQ2_9BACL|nr:hypothetical protein [Aneurinibacillus soli]PYE57072.1 hypothetical protein DFP93_13412 [Aneurinibacillus soli]BAU29579.1 hypothetical protein CB4_03779 [Aneurinibacillus soli]
MDNQSLLDAQQSLNNAFNAVSQLEGTPNAKQVMNSTRNAMEHAHHAIQQVRGSTDEKAVSEMEQQLEQLQARFELAQDGSSKHVN